MKELNVDTFRPQRVNGVPSVHIRRIGTICFSKLAVAEIGIKAETKVVFFQDQDGAYVATTYGSEGYPLRSNNSGSRLFNHAALADLLLPKSAASQKYKVGKPTEHQGRLVYPLIKC